MKTLKNLIDAKQLSKKEQQAVKGGGTNNICYADCSADEFCKGYICYQYPPEVEL